MRLLRLLIFTVLFTGFAMAAEIDRTVVPAYLDGKAGYLDVSKKEFVIPPQYKDAAFFVDDAAIVTLMDGEMAVIDKDGHILLEGYSKIKPVYVKGNLHPNYFDQSKDIHSRVFVAEKEGNLGIFSIDNGWIVPATSYISDIYFVDNDTLYYDGNLIIKNKKIPVPKGYKATGFDLEHGFVWIEKKRESLKGGTGVIRFDGSVFIKPKYNELERADSGYWLGSTFTSNTVAMFRIKFFLNPYGSHVKTDVISPEGKVVRSFKSRYKPYIRDTNIYSLYMDEGEEYYADIATGEKVTVEEIIDGKYMVLNKENYKGIKGADDNILILPKYGEIKHLEDDKFAASNDYILGKWGVISIDGSELAPFEYDSIRKTGHSGVYLVSKKGEYGLIDNKGNVLYEPSVHNSFYFNGFGYAIAYKNNKYGLLDSKGKEIASFIYQSIYNPPETATKPVYIAQRDDLWGMLDMGAKVIIPFEYGYISDYTGAPDWYRTENKERNRYGAVNTVTGVNIAPVHDGIIPYDNVVVIYARRSGDVPAHTSFIDFNGKKIADYDSIKKSESSPFVFFVERNNRYGIADEYGQLSVPCKYKRINEVDPVYFRATDESGNIVYIDRNGTEYRAAD